MRIGWHANVHNIKCQAFCHLVVLFLLSKTLVYPPLMKVASHEIADKIPYLAKPALNELLNRVLYDHELLIN